MEERLFLHYDCRHFLGDKPCTYHKRYKASCADCKYYNPAGKRILIIKLGSRGDVLRTTPILRGLKDKHKDAHISWLVSKDSSGILKGNPYIDKILIYNFDTLPFLMVKEYDLLINLDLSFDSSSVATIVRADEKRGFGLNSRGDITCFDRTSHQWYDMSFSDEMKKKNVRTYQDIMCDIVRIKPKRYEMILGLSDEERAFGREFLIEKKLREPSYKIGINTGAGNRWPLKKWTIDGYASLISRISQQLNAKMLLLGGRLEEGRNRKLLDMFPDILVDTGTGNTLRQFIALIAVCDLVVCSDTLAMHIAIALKKKTVVLFGPTSAAEIDLYKRGKKILPPMDCVNCYRNTCEKLPNCMENIDADTVFEAVRRLYNVSAKSYEDIGIS